MTAKSIFEVDINDAKFKAFTGLVDKYYDQLTKMPGQWQKVNQAMAPDATVAALGAQTQILSKILEGEKSVAVEAERTERSWRGISHYTKDAASNIASTALTLAKWTGIAGVLGAIVGAVSLDRVAASVAETRRSAGGFGIGYGQQQAFGLNLGRFIDPGAVLSASRNALFDVTNPAFVALRAAGINPQAGGNAADVSAQLLQKLPSLFAGTPQGLVGPRAKSLGLDQFFSLDDIVRYLGADSGERRKQLDHFKEDSRNLDLQKQTTRGWQDFNTALGRAELGIENTFVKGLTPLVVPLEHLAGSFERAAATFLNGADKWIGPLGDGIERFAKYLTGNDFQKDLGTFKDDIGTVASGIATLAGWIKYLIPSASTGGPTSPAEAAAGPAKKGAVIGGGLGLFAGPIGGLLGAGIGGTIGAGYGALKYANAEGDFLKLIGDLENAKRDPNAVSRTGAVGLYQIEPDTARQYGRDPSKLTEPIYNAQTAQLILRKLVAKYHGDVDKVLLAYHSGEGAVDNPARFPTGPEGRGYVSRAHANPGYQKVVIEIHDATGGNPITAGAQVGLGGAP